MHVRNTLSHSYTSGVTFMRWTPEINQSSALVALDTCKKLSSSFFALDPRWTPENPKVLSWMRWTPEKNLSSDLDALDARWTPPKI